MKGLLRDNFYAAYANEKVWFIIMFLVGIIVAAVTPDGSIFIRNYMLICLVGFSYMALDSLQKDSTCKWEKYKLTVLVTRAKGGISACQYSFGDRNCGRDGCAVKLSVWARDDSESDYAFGVCGVNLCGTGIWGVIYNRIRLPN